MNHMDANATDWEKARWELHENTTGYFWLILEATPRKATVVRPLTSPLKNHPSKTSKTCGTLLEKQGRTPKWRSSVGAYTWALSVLADQ